MRKTLNLNKSWQFIGPDGATKVAHLPHTWNSIDGQDGGSDYWYGPCIYRRKLTMPEFNKDEEQVCLGFQRVNASTRVFLNGSPVCIHDSGYSTLRVNVTDISTESNLLEITVDDSVNDRVYPQKADFTFHGGIYQDINLIVLNRLHFDMNYYGRSGIQITPEIKGDTSVVRIRTFANVTESGNEIKVYVNIEDGNGKKVVSGIGADCTLSILEVHLWDGLKDPYLYTVTARLMVQGEQVDMVSSRFGVRSFSVDAQKGLFLNGRSHPLWGVSRHQDWKGIGNALTKEYHRQDVELIREIGTNRVCLAHYQHDQYFYDLCDEYGLVVWTEIPYISEHMLNGRENTTSQMKELTTQNYNHPCIVNWGASNEITIFTKDKKDMLDNHRMLNDLCREMDKTRPTALACHVACGPFNRSAHIIDLVPWNLYLGWYVPRLFLNDLWMKFFHFVYSKWCLGYSEYGCEAMMNLYSSKLYRGDHTEEYQMVYHEYMLWCFERNPYLWATHVWNIFDLVADARDQGGEPGMNHRGLVTFDRKIKEDSFHLYKAYWSDRALVHVCGSRYTDRVEESMVVTAYSNQPSVTPYVDGKEMETRIGSRVFRFTMPLGEVGKSTTIKAVAGTCTGEITVTHTADKNPDYKLRSKKTASTNWV